MNFLHSTTWLIIVLIAFVAVRAWDAYVSSDYDRYGLTEANPLARDKFHNFEAWKHWAATAVIVAATVVIWSINPDGWILAAVIGVGSAAWMLAKLGKKPKKRAEQINWMRHAKATWEAGGNVEMQMIRRHERVYPYNFNFIYSDDPEHAEQIVYEALRARIMTRPESDWFNV